MVNISSPNTPGLRDLQAPAALDELLGRVMAARARKAAAGKSRPVFVKIAPDVAEEDLPAIVERMLANGVDAIAVSNTTLARPGLDGVADASEAGGLSGRPLFHRSTAMLARVYRLANGRVPLIGIGGIDSPGAALAKIEAGASLLQLYTGLIYEGPGLIGAMKKHLVEAVRHAGATSITALTGTRGASLGGEVAGRLAMCGILVVAERTGLVDERRFRSALDAIAHRGPDGAGIAHFTLGQQPGRRSIALGHRRLAILDLSDRAAQPFRRDGGVLTYNGEIYNFRALRANLASTFTTDGDTEVLFETLRHRGLDGLTDALGMWAFCHLDEATGRLVAARDRLGKKPLYYFASAQTICFASEIAAIMSYLGTRPGIAPATVDTYLAYGWTLPGTGEATPIANIRQVVPGGHVTVDLAAWQLATGTYLAPDDWLPRDRAPEGDLAEAVRAAVLDRLVSDRKVGLLLSGGVDSSLILSVLASEGLQERVHCFIGDAGKSEDADYAARITTALGVTAETIPLQYADGSIDRFLSICRHQEKPFPLIGNVLGLPELYEVIAARDVPVVLDGTGADEVFGGYWERYYRLALAEAWDAGDRAWIETSLDANADQPRIDEIGRATVAALAAGIWPPSSTVGAFPTAEIMPMLDRFCAADVAEAAPADPLARRRSTLTAGLHLDVTAALLPEWLWQNDRSAMRSGVENRSPFLDTRITSHYASGYRAKFNGRWNKYELRRLFDHFRPAPTQWRREKQGFRWVFARFLGANRARVIDLIAASRLLPARVKTHDLVDALRRDEELIFSDLTQRCLCLAGLEAATGLSLQHSSADVN